MAHSGAFAEERLRSFSVAASTLLVWDILLTLDKEVDMVWKADWNLMKVLYLFQRYLPIVDTIFLNLQSQLGENLGAAECLRLYSASGWLMFFGFALSEVILTLRAWAVWNRERRLTIILVVLWVMVWGPIAAFIAHFIRSIIIGPPPYAGYRGCFVYDANTSLFLCFLLLTVWNIVVFGLMAVVGIRIRAWSSKSKLFQLIYRDGAIYYLYVFAFSALNVIAIVTFRSGYQFTLTSLERCLHSVLASRVLLNLRICAREDSSWSERLTEFVMSENPPDETSNSD
ncbi:hypothetical protein GALMADRAFT_264430 [Galerina marginata CBS 339.88]|uniref:DUF6533 domain-containing protein n=1 Tax=Galerina marginata (strain CBS 339.88) TaxID=685588 RepID=A0A067TT70_GALM3|nr:hypothetical protein GALMADRAFT_264430 [Galerina marginata CBS 339.88]